MLYHVKTVFHFPRSRDLVLKTVYWSNSDTKLNISTLNAQKYYGNLLNDLLLLKSWVLIELMLL